MSQQPSNQPAIFLDRDGTLNYDRDGYISDPEDLHLIEGVGQALRRLRAAGYLLVLITNQAGLGKGLMDEKDLDNIHQHLESLLTEEGVRLDGIYFCGHHPQGSVEQYHDQGNRRKPEPGMLLEAAEELQIDIAKSWMIGDKPSDAEAGKTAGCRTILLDNPLQTPQPDDAEHADFRAENLLAAAEIVIAEDIDPGRAHPETHKKPLRTGPPELDSRRLLADILRELRHQRVAHKHQEFSLSKMLAGMIQCLVFFCLVLVYVAFNYWSTTAVHMCLAIGLILQTMVVALLLANR